MKSSQNSLTEVTFLILLSLKDSKHGYAIIKEVEKWTNGRVVIAGGTMYSALETLQRKGWIENIDNFEKRNIYQITEQGLEVLDDDFKRLETDINLYNIYRNREEGNNNDKI